MLVLPTRLDQMSAAERGVGLRKRELWNGKSSWPDAFKMS